MRRDLTAPIMPAPLPEGVVLQPFDAPIAPACRDLMNRAYDEVVPFDKWWNWLTADSEYDPAYVYVACADKAVIGFCHSWTEPFVKDLVVDEAFRRRGLGAALLTKAMTIYATRGEAFVDLKTDVDNLTAQSLYRRLGFEIVERIG
jgi:ribosomal protein S18 acetylase RimI-like enzyme